MTDILARLADRQGPKPVNQPGAQERRKDRALERFLKFAPPKFLGGPDPEMTENWLGKIINIFAALNYTEKRGVNFAAFQFEGVGRAWWNMIRGTKKKHKFLGSGKILQENLMKSFSHP